MPESDFDKRIKQAERKIKPLFAALEEKKKKLADDVIHQAAVAKVIMDDCATALAQGETIELFVNGSQKIRRENPAIKAFNTTTKSYVALMKQLMDMLPETVQDKAGTEIMDFIRSGISGSGGKPK